MFLAIYANSHFLQKHTVLLPEKAKAPWPGIPGTAGSGWGSVENRGQARANFSQVLDTNLWSVGFNLRMTGWSGYFK